MTIIIEAAAMNFRAQSMGYDATETFNRNLNNLIKVNSKNDEKHKEEQEHVEEKNKHLISDDNKDSDKK